MSHENEPLRIGTKTGKLVKLKEKMPLFHTHVLPETNLLDKGLFCVLISLASPRTNLIECIKQGFIRVPAIMWDFQSQFT